MKISYRQLWLLIVCWQQRITFHTAADIAGVSSITARRWFRRFRYHLVYESPILQGVVEVDEAFVGRRRHRNQRIVLGAYERGSGRVVLRVTTNRDQGTTDQFLLDHVGTESTVCTDAATCYQGIDAFFGYRHTVCNHSEFVFGPTNHIENVWSRMKRFIRRTFHHYHKEWLPRLLREFEARINAPEIFQSPENYLSTCLVAVPSR
jgi:IS1 family transposase